MMQQMAMQQQMGAMPGSWHFSGLPWSNSLELQVTTDACSHASASFVGPNAAKWVGGSAA